MNKKGEEEYRKRMGLLIMGLFFIGAGIVVIILTSTGVISGF